MNKLDELLKGLKMELFSLGEIAGFLNGKGHEKAISDDGKYIVVNSKFVSSEGKIIKYSDVQIVPLYIDDILIVMSDLPNGKALAKTFLVEHNDRYTLNQRIGCISVKNKNALLPKYLNYILNRSSELLKYNNGLDQTNLKKNQILEVSIPIPCPDNPEKSLKIQQEIVRVLDELTSLTNQLTTELETERQNRKKQFEFFREQLFRFEEKEVKYISLGELSKIGDGLHGTPKYNDSGNYYFINGNNLNSGEILITDRTKKVDDNTYNKYGIEFFKNKTIFLSINGTIGSVSFYNDEKIVLGKSVAYFNIISNELLHKYLYYIFQIDFSKNYFEKNKTGSTIKNLGLKALRSFKIPIPPIKEQERIVKLLDQLDATHTAIEEEITKEIKLRTQQYEYYREKLLTFPKN